MTTPDELVRGLNTEWSRSTTIDLICDTNRGTLTPEAEIVHRGRRTFVVEVTVLGGEHRRIAKLVATQLAPAASPATASPGPSGR